LARSRDQLRGILVGRRIVSIDRPGGRYRDRQPDGLEQFMHEMRQDRGASIVRGIDVKGKFMYWTLGPDWSLWCTYGMSGQWEPTRSPHSALSVTHGTDRVGILEDCMPSVHFNDQRHFGTLKFVKGREALAKKLSTLGPDMLNSPPTVLEFLDRLYHRDGKTVVEALMDQSVVSGVGNYVKAECIHRSGISPHRIVNSLTAAEIVLLHEHTIDVMRSSYESKGATLRSYKNVDGSAGQAQFGFRVYDRDRDAQGHSVEREITADGRTTHWCRICQT
jgi:DNA-formamidopyrimidine glycosylase